MNFVARFLARTRQRGSSDLTVSLLLTAAGAAMVGLSVPSLFRSSDTASRTFDRQVQILERGAGTPGASTAVPPVFDTGEPAQNTLGQRMGVGVGAPLPATTSQSSTAPASSSRGR